MKTFLMVCLTFFTGLTFSQAIESTACDTIILNNGHRMPCRIDSLTKTQIFYQECGNVLPNSRIAINMTERLVYGKDYPTILGDNKVSNKQEKEKELPKNVISLETGIWSRGLIGISYTRNFRLNDYFHISTDVSGGLGLSAGGFDLNEGDGIPSNFFTLNPMLNIKIKSAYLMLGVEGTFYRFAERNGVYTHVGTYESTCYTGWAAIAYGLGASNVEPETCTLPLYAWLPMTYRGFSVSPVIGVYKHFDTGFTCKLRVSALFYSGGIKPSIGMSFGYAF